MSLEYKFKNSVEWFNKLEDKQIKRIVEFMECDALFRLEKEDIDKIKEIVKLIINDFENAIEEEKIFSKLVKAGMEEEYSEIFINYSQEFRGEYIASKVINNIEINEFKKIVLFIVNKIHLYREINFIPFEEFIETFAFNNEIDGKAVLRLINTYINRLINRDMTIESIRDMLIKVIEINDSYVEVFEKILLDNLQELRMANMMFKLNKIENFIESFEEEEEFDETDEVLDEN